MAFLEVVPIADADGWTAPITVTLVATYDHENDDGSRTTVSGTAMFTYSRVKLADKLTYPKLAFAGNLEGDALIETGEYLPVQCAIGKAPGWLVFFGPQDPVEDAFTQTVTYSSSGESTPDPVVTHLDATCSISLFCAPVAPGRYMYALDFLFTQTLVGLNNGLGVEPTDDPIDETPPPDPNAKKNVPYSVSLIREGNPATSTQPEVGSVYRLTFPDDCAALSGINSLTIIYNGMTLKPNYAGSGYISNIGNVFQNALTSPDLTTGVAIQATAYVRSPYALDVLMTNYGDTLAAGTINYVTWGGFQHLNSSVSVNSFREELSNPFSRSAVTHTGDPDVMGDHDYTVAFA